MSQFTLILRVTIQEKRKFEEGKYAFRIWYWVGARSPLITLGLVWAETSDSLVLVLNWAILKVVLGTRLVPPVWTK